jgi:hypothetical protein
MAAAEQPLLHRLEAMLPAAHPLVRGEAVLDEVQRAARLEDAAYLRQRGCDLRDRAERPGTQGGVEAVVLEWQRLAVQAGPLHADVGHSQAFLGQLPANVRGLDCCDPRHRVGVERNVEPGAEAELDDLTAEPGAHSAALAAGPSWPRMRR